MGDEFISAVHGERTRVLRVGTAVGRDWSGRKRGGRGGEGPRGESFSIGPHGVANEGGESVKRYWGRGT